jgi:hypothetical protein
MMVARRSQQMAATPKGGRRNKRQRVSTAVDVAPFDLEADTAFGASEISRSGSPVPPHTALPNATAVPTTNTTQFQRMKQENLKKATRRQKRTKIERKNIQTDVNTSAYKCVCCGKEVGPRFPQLVAKFNAACTHKDEEGRTVS